MNQSAEDLRENFAIEKWHRAQSERTSDEKRILRGYTRFLARYWDPAEERIDWDLYDRRNPDLSAADRSER